MSNNNVAKILKELQKRSDDPEEVEKYFNSVLQRHFEGRDLDPTHKAQIADDAIHRLLGEAALQEIPGLEDMESSQALQTAKEKAYQGLTDLEKSLYINPKISHAKLQDVNGTYHGTYHPNQGIKINEGFKDLPKGLYIPKKQLGLGVLFHEASHGLDEVSKRAAKLQDEIEKRANPNYKLEKFRKLSDKNYKPTVLEMLSDEELAREHNSVKSKLDNFLKNNPDKIDEALRSPSLRTFESQEVPKVIPKEFNEMAPSKLQNLYSGTGHWFKRNFPFESLKSVLKTGIKGMKSIGVGAIPALAASAVAGYAPNTKAATVAETTAKALDEGDPTSFIFPTEAGEGEEAEVKKMIEEAKQKKFGKIQKTLNGN